MWPYTHLKLKMYSLTNNTIELYFDQMVLKEPIVNERFRKFLDMYFTDAC